MNNFLVCYPMRAERPVASPAGGVEPLPAPQVTSRDPWPADVPVPLAVKRVVALAESAGWTARATYARGPWQNKRGFRIVHSVAVRFTRSVDVGTLPLWGMAVWIAPVDGDGGRLKWTAESILVYRGARGLLAGLQVSELREWLLARGVMPAEWYDAVVARRAERRDRAAQTAKGRLKKAREGLS